MRIFEKRLSNSKEETFALLFFLLLAVVPLLVGIIYALSYSLGLTGILSHGFTMRYWQETLSDIEFWFSLGYTLYISLATIGLTIILALTLALYLKTPLQYGFPGFSVYVPLAFPAIVVAFLVFQLASQSGFFARIIYQLGVISDSSSFPGLVNDSFGIGIITAHTFMAVPFFTLYFMNVYDQEDICELSQVAETLGASKFAQIRRIVVPVLLRRSFSTLVLYSIFVMGSYEIPLLLGRQSPQMMSVLVIQKLRKFSLAAIPEAYIMALVFIGILIGLLILIFNLQKSTYDID